MPRYIVQHFYKSHVAQYPAGQVVEMDADLAAWFNRDSPGVLKLVDPPLPEEEARLDRMIRKAKTRIVRGQ
jgi:hypothetical protein